MQRFTTYLMVITAAVFWGANFNLAVPVVAEMHPFVAGATRYLLAAAVMLMIMCWRRECIPLRYARQYVLLGVVGVFGFNLLFFLGMQTTSAVNGALIMALNPLLTSIVALVLLSDRPSLRQLLAYPVGFAGVGVVVLGGGAALHAAIGDVYIFGASLAWAFYNVLLRKHMPSDVSGIASTAAIMSAGALALTAVAVLAGKPFIVPSVHAGSALLVMTLGGGVLAYLFWNVGVAKLGAAQAAIFLNLVPVASMLIAVFEGHPPNHAQWLGGLLVIGAVLFASAGFAGKSSVASAS